MNRGERVAIPKPTAENTETITTETQSTQRKFELSLFSVNSVLSVVNLSRALAQAWWPAALTCAIAMPANVAAM
jgi:hypothetical protein